MATDGHTFQADLTPIQLPRIGIGYVNIARIFEFYNILVGFTFY